MNMLTQQNMAGKSFHERQNRSVLNGPSPGQLGGHAFPEYSLNNQVCHLRDWRRDPYISQIRACMRRKVAEYFIRGKEPSKDLEQRATKFAYVVEKHLFLDAASKEEYENQETLLHRMGTVVDREKRKKNLSQANSPSSGPNFTKKPTAHGCLKSDVPSLPFSYSKDSGTKCFRGMTNSPGQLVGRMVQSPEQASLSTPYTSVEEPTHGGAIENGPGLFQSCITHTPGGLLNEHCQQQYFHQADGLNLASIRVYADNVQNSASMVYPSTNEQIVDLSTSHLQNSQHILGGNSKISNMFPCMIPDTQSSTLEDALRPYLQLNRPKAQSQCYLGEQYGSCTQMNMENESNLPQTSKEQLNISPGMLSESWRSSLENIIQSQPLMQKFQGNQQLLKQAHLQFHNAFMLRQLSSEELNGASENPALVSGCNKTATDAICSDQFRSSKYQDKLLSYQHAGYTCSPVSHKKHTQAKDLHGSPESNDNSDILRPPKRQKMENLSGNGVPQELTGLTVERIPHLEHWPESPPSNGSEVKDANIELLTNSIKDRKDLTLIPDKASISPGCHTSSPVSHKKHTQAKDLHGSPESNDNAYILRPPKRQNMEDLSGNGIPQELTGQTVERIPHLEHWPGSPPSNSSEVKDANIELLTNSIKDRKDLTLIPDKVSISPGCHTSSPVSHKKHTQAENLHESPESNDNADILRPPKRQKVENLSGNGIPLELTAQVVERIPHIEHWPESSPSNSSEVKDANIELITHSIKDRKDLTLLPDKVSVSPIESISAHMPEQRDSTEINEIIGNVKDDSNRLHSESVLSASDIMNVDRKEEVLVQTNFEEAKLGFKDDLSIPQSEHEERCKSDNQNVIAASLIESFTAEQIKDHLSSLRQWSQAERENSTIGTVNENTCQLCLADRLCFAPTPIYCSVCFASIKRKVTYYCTPNENAMPHCFCSKCYREVRGGSITVNGFTVSKKNLYKRMNNEETDEPWVQCDTCEGWQHQICALYNDRTDLEGKAKYICPKCCLEEIETQKRTPLLETAVFRAKDLPSTELSDHLEQRLFRRLKEDREERARVTGKNLDEVLEAKDLVVRVVLSVDKRVTVKKQFLDIFQDQSYPEEFQYRSKVVLLFQKIEGVDVCLFSMYVQEYGSECSHPNHRCVYISYLDSVKYFRPDIQSACGEALRTFVYHEILIGYLEYCKKIGFLTCYIWACPPVKGEDYILYCHPQVQKTPKSDKLRHWYHALLRKAAKENVVVDFTNLYDHFFVPTGEWKTKITAARIPYFDGDYWSGSVERWIRDIEKECGADGQQVKKLMTNRALKAMGLKDPSSNATKDILIMQKLGNSIQPLKEDFIVVHLQYVCAECHEVILSGLPWFCNQCPKYQLCERCHDSRESDTHTVNHKEEHLLHQVKVDDVPCDTNDKDLVLANNLLENRHSFLNFCQTNHYQFDTVRRAKHSSMMILHELRDPNVLFAGLTCTMCSNLTRSDKSWLCETCPKFCICASCHQEKGRSSHPHELIPHSSRPTRGTKTKDSQHKGPSMREFVNLIHHVAYCHLDRSNPCTTPNCCKMKKIFVHVSKCTRRFAGGCEICKKLWLGLSAHSRICRNPDCRVPRCRDLKKNARNADIVVESDTGYKD